MDEITAKIIFSIKERAKQYTEDNLKFPSKRDYLLIENAMLIGSSVATEVYGWRFLQEVEEDL